MTIDASMFDFDAMKQATGADPFAAPKRTFEVDNRFYRLPKDEDGNGQAVIRFLPDSEKNMIQQVYKINTTINKNGKRRFVNELSPQTIGKPCPFQEKWADLWNAGDKEGARDFSRTTRYYTNIKVLKDPREPENEGKIFILDMSNSMKDKIQALLEPSEQDVMLGATPKQLFNPLKGNSYRLVSKKGANGFINYDSSSAVETEDSIYESPEEALADIKENTHKLSSFLQDDSYLTYEELKEKMAYVTFANMSSTQAQSDSLVDNADALVNQGSVAQPEVHEPVQQSQQSQPAQEAVPQTATTQADSLDSLLEGLI